MLFNLSVNQLSGVNLLAATAMVRKTFHVKNAMNDVMADNASHFAQFVGTC